MSSERSGATVVDEPALEGLEQADPPKILPHACFLLPVSLDGCEHAECNHPKHQCQLLLKKDLI
jgi:hypothetical protein